MRRKNVFNKAVSLLLALCMVIGFLPLTSLADSNESQGSTKESLPNYFVDSFNDGRYVNGSLYQWTNRATDAELVQRTVTSDGYLCISNRLAQVSDKNNAITYLTISDGSAEYAETWSNYSVETRGKFTSRVLTNQSKLGLMGRLQVADDGTITSYYAYIRNDNKNMFLYKSSINAEGVQTLTSIKSVAMPTVFKADQDYTLKMTFAGNQIKVFLDGVEKISVTDDTYSCGSVGLQMTRIGDAMFDYIKVIHDDGSTVFQDDFTDTRYINGVNYQWTTDAENVWGLDDGAYVASAQEYSSSLVSVSNGTIDYASAWADYSIESDFMLEQDDSTAGYLIRAIGSNYYELRIRKDNIALYQSGTKELTSVLTTTDVGIWHFAKLKVDGTVIRAYVNSALVLTYDTVNDADACITGAPGLKTGVAVKYDNFGVYPLEYADVVKTGKYGFNVPSVSNLIIDWAIDEDFALTDGKLVSAAATGFATAMLKGKTAAKDYSANAVLTAPKGSSFAVIGRQALDGSAYYTLTGNMDGDLVLTKTVDVQTTTLATVSYDDMYLAGIRLQADKRHILGIQMFGNVIEGYVDGIRIIRYEDANPLPQGVSGIKGTAGVTFESLNTASVDAVVKLTILDGEGNPVGTAANPLQVPLGKVPDIKYYQLKAEYHNGFTETIMLDTAEVEAFSGSTLGAKSAKVIYQGAETKFYYTIIDRIAEIAKLESELAALNVSAITLNDAAAIKALADRYNDLSSAEKVNITAAGKEKIAAAQEAIEVLKYPELKDTNVVFKDEFDTPASRDMYDNSPDTLTWRRNSGYWYVENGNMVQYMTTVVGKPTQFNFSAILVDENGNPRNFDIRSVSLDVQFIDPSVWGGIEFCFGGPNQEKFYFSFTDKSHRVRLTKNATEVEVIYAAEDPNPITFTTGQWYNLRVVLDGNGLIKCYIDDRLWIEYQDVPDVTNDQVLTNGSVGIYGAEHYVRYDNLIVRGTELPNGNTNGVTTNPNLEAGSYADNFNDETAGESPSHWIELNTEDKWLVKQDGDNKIYASKDGLTSNSHTWLHVFETDVDYFADIRVPEMGYFPVVGLTTRVNADESWIKGGYDFTLQKWFISVRLGVDFEPVITYAENMDTAVDFSKFVTLRMKLVGEAIELYANGKLVVTADAGTKVMPGRVGVFTEQCNVEVDNVALILLSGQGRVNDGVLEYYTNTGTSFHSILEMWDDDGNQILLLYQDGSHSISTDGGQTFTRSTMYSDNGFKGNGSLELHDGTYINIKRRGGDASVLASQDRIVSLSTDGGKSWPEIALVPIDYDHTYSQPAEHINEVQLNDGTWRIFYTLVNSTYGTSFTFYSDDSGYTWKESKNSPLDFSNVNGWNESYVIKVTKDTTDINGREIKAGTLVQYSSHNECSTMRYTLSFDGGETWVGDYAMPQIPCGDNSCCIKEDPYEPGTYYMTAPYNIVPGIGFNHPRFRVVLLRSYDGLNWEFLADVDRWGDISDGNRGNIMQQVNAYISITEDYVFPIFSRSDQYSTDGSHNLQIGRMYRFEKDKLEAYDPWPQEYVIPDKSITSIEVDPVKNRIELNDSNPVAGAKIKVNYYNAESEYVDLTEAMDLTKNVGQPVAFVTLPDLSTPGVKPIVVDYRHFRAIYYVSVGMSDVPAITGVENGKTYCSAQEIYVGDANGDLVSVTVNGQAVTLKDGVFTASAKSGAQTIVATDAKGNTHTVTITVNDGHTWSEEYSYENKRHWHTCTVEGCGANSTKQVCKIEEATCTEEAKCRICGGIYGEKLEHQMVDGKCAVCGYEEPVAQNDFFGIIEMIFTAIWDFFKNLFALLGIG